MHRGNGVMYPLIYLELQYTKYSNSPLWFNQRETSRGDVRRCELAYSVGGKAWLQQDRQLREGG